MKIKQNLTSALIAFAVAGLSACGSEQSGEPETQAEYPAAARLGQSWDVIDEDGNQSIWLRSESPQENSLYTLFKTPALNSEDAFDRLEISAPSNDRVIIIRKSVNGKKPCEYTGRIWVETSLDGYDAFREDNDPNKRQDFYRIVNGTYLCAGTGEPMSWVAKINE